MLAGVSSQIPTRFAGLEICLEVRSTVLLQELGKSRFFLAICSRSFDLFPTISTSKPI